ncbi:MAG: hypothetical protein ACRD2T_16380, partial [Thermoanaerobaculia bacterium]
MTTYALASRLVGALIVAGGPSFAAAETGSFSSDGWAPRIDLARAFQAPAAGAFQAPAAPPAGGGAFASPLGSGTLSAKGGMGFTADPSTFLLAG